MKGWGLHSGVSAEVRFVPAPGPVRVRSGASEVPVTDLVFDGAERSTRGRDPSGTFTVRTTEHLFAALAALGIREGLLLEIDGPELPILDGGAAAWFDALARLGLVPSAPRLAIVRAATIDVGTSRYELEPDEGVALEVTVDFGDPRLASHAAWDGAAADFRARIAPARTFGFEHELDALTARGLARHAPPESVVLVGRERIHAAGAPFEADEPARHKLLDLAGDLYAHGGPPRGRIRATRPGHAATHAAVARARQDGILAATGSA